MMVDREDQQRTRIAWLYYVEGRTQGQIAEQLGLSRVRVNRELAICRELGIVQIRINSRLKNCVELERELVKHYRLANAVVVPAPSDSENFPAVIGGAAGIFISDHMSDRMSIGIGWGRTLRASLQSVERKRWQGMTVVSLMGGLTRGSAINTYETASRFADILDAECYYLAAPTFTSSPQSRATILEQGAITEVIERGRSVDMALVSVGALERQSTIRRLGLVSAEDTLSLQLSGAIGDLLGHYLDEAGELVDHPMNDRVIGLSPEDLGKVRLSILASGGVEKLPIIRAVLSRGYVNVIVTDEQTARKLLAPR
ncbi:MAG: sugar-binding transcriptional regulator [Geminicoccaceae bacterium]|nr:sugar-binding transcriptional regulator [Geminicoccaceae bacterium]